MEKLVFKKSDSKKVIFYDGTNQEKVIKFFKDEIYGKFLKVIDRELHYKTREYYSYNTTIIKPGVWLSFNYGEDAWYYKVEKTEKEFNKEYLTIYV